MIAAGPATVGIIDYKFGYQPVTDTDQFQLYAVCGRVTPSVADLFDGRTVESVIIQPAVSEQPIVHEHTAGDLHAFSNRFLLAVERAERGDGGYNPGPWCKYCPAAAAACPAKRKQVGDFLQYDPKQQTQLAEAMALVDQLKEQIKAVEAEVFANLENGLPVPGWKLVAKQSRRYWADEAAVLHRLRYNKNVKRDQYLVETLRSPAQVEKATKGVVELADLIDSKSSGTTIAPESDKRAAVATAGANIPAALTAAMGKA
jgi:hypothetical protein